MELDELQDLTVDEQKEELENLSREQLKDLREAETRNTALDNIDRELAKYDREEVQSSSVDLEEDEDDSSEAEELAQEKFTEEEIQEIKEKVDYIIERCKTTSQEGYENYTEDEQ